MRQQVLVVLLSLAAAVGVGIWVLSDGASVAERVTPDALEQVTNPVIQARHERARKVMSELDMTRPKMAKPIALDSISKAILSIQAEGDLEKEKELTKLYAETLKMLTEDQRQAVQMRMMVDRSETRSALRLARHLMDSDDPAVRQAVVDVLGWIGRGAITELTQMLGDPDLVVAESAMKAWQVAFDQFEGDADKSAVLAELLPQAEERSEMDFLLMSVTKMRTQVGLETLSNIIEENRGQELADAALSMWEHLTGDYEYQNPESVNAYIEMVEQEQEEASEKWRLIHEALRQANGDQAKAREILGLPPIEGQGASGQDGGEAAGMESATDAPAATE